MNINKKILNYIHILGGVSLIIGTIMPFYPVFNSISPFVYTIGLVMYSSILLMNSYKGRNFIIKRLFTQQQIGICVLYISGLLMWLEMYGISPLNDGTWKVCLSIGAILHLYSTFRISHELKKEENKQ